VHSRAFFSRKRKVEAVFVYLKMFNKFSFSLDSGPPSVGWQEAAAFCLNKPEERKFSLLKMLLKIFSHSARQL
jgi:hypothetical protein